MSIKPILFNTEMVRAIREGRKTETRRLIIPKYRDNECGFQIVQRVSTGEFVRVEVIDENEYCTRYLQPKYSPGDILWVRETWSFWPCFDCDNEMCHGRGIYYRGNEGCFAYKTQTSKVPYDEKWKPSIHMPKEAAREFLEVTDVWAEPLQNITAAGIRAEGLGTMGAFVGDPIAREEFKLLWNSTIPKDKLPTYGWQGNPWVWVYQFERCEKPKEWC